MSTNRKEIGKKRFPIPHPPPVILAAVDSYELEEENGMKTAASDALAVTKAPAKPPSAVQGQIGYEASFLLPLSVFRLSAHVSGFYTKFFEDPDPGRFWQG
jgi:hypothetical protein